MFDVVVVRAAGNAEVGTHYRMELGKRLRMVAADTFAYEVANRADHEATWRIVSG